MWVHFFSLLLSLWNIAENLSHIPLIKHSHHSCFIYMFCVHITVDNELLSVRFQWKKPSPTHAHTLAHCFHFIDEQQRCRFRLFNSVWHLFRPFLHTQYRRCIFLSSFHNNKLDRVVNRMKFCIYSTLGRCNFAMHSLKLLWKSGLNYVLLFMDDKKKFYTKMLHSMYVQCAVAYYTVLL